MAGVDVAIRAFHPRLAAEPNTLAGGMFQAISHAFAKAAMFMAAGLMAGVLGHDRIADLRGDRAGVAGS
jgi:formate hydrogenlyase subunit 3/multisubunit Na+/H+ antiporter MnhD subunit